MENDRRDFLKSVGIITGAASIGISAGFGELPAQSLQSKSSDLPDEMNEAYWAWVQQAYTASPNIINLNNGGVSPQPKFVQDTFETYNRLANEAPSYYMWQILDQGREPIRAKLAELAGCSSDEIAICRNTTEALNNVIFGLDLKKGDEIVLSKQDYPNVINAWKMREMRDGIKLVWVDLELPSESDEYLVGKYTSEFNAATRVVCITHMINWTGQIMPVNQICTEAKRKGIITILDSAHMFAHVRFKISDIDCDFLGTSLHKWLCCPFGTGMLYARKEMIKHILPLFPNAEPQSDDIRKFEAMGTRSFPSEMAIGQALNFHNVIGSELKEKRLRFLKNYWANEALKLDRFKLNTSLKAEYSCALANFSIEGMKAADISKYLFDKYKIHAVAIEWENISGVRITPHIYTRKYELDRLLEALKELAG